MALPDISTLTADELQQLAVAIAQKIAADEQTAQQQHAALGTTVDGIIADLDTEITRVQAVLDTTNATINSGPAPYIKDVARAVKRSAQANKDLARYVRGL